MHCSVCLCHLNVIIFQSSWNWSWALECWSRNCIVIVYVIIMDFVRSSTTNMSPVSDLRTFFRLYVQRNVYWKCQVELFSAPPWAPPEPCENALKANNMTKDMIRLAQAEKWTKTKGFYRSCTLRLLLIMLMLYLMFLSVMIETETLWSRDLHEN